MALLLWHIKIGKIRRWIENRLRRRRISNLRVKRIWWSHEGHDGEGIIGPANLVITQFDTF